MTLGKRIYELRKSSGLSQEQLAIYIGVSRQTISNWEADFVHPSLDKIIVISDLFQVSLDQLIKGEKKEYSKEVNIEELAKLNWQYQKRTIAFIVGIIFIVCGVLAYILVSAIESVRAGLGYTLYRYIEIGEFASPLGELTVANRGIIGLIIVGIIIIVVCFCCDIKNKRKKK